MYHDGKAADKCDIMFIFFVENLRERISTAVHKVEALLQGILEEPQLATSIDDFSCALSSQTGPGAVL